MAPWIENLAAGALVVLSLALVIIALRSWRHSGSSKTLLLALGFALFLCKAVLVGVGLFQWADVEHRLFLPGLVLDLGILSVFYLAIFKRSGS